MALRGVMTIKEASRRWNVSVQTLTSAVKGQKGLPPRFEVGEYAKSDSTWLITEEGMTRLYGEEPFNLVGKTINIDTEWLYAEEYRPEDFKVGERWLIVFKRGKESTIEYFEKLIDADDIGKNFKQDGFTMQDDEVAFIGSVARNWGVFELLIEAKLVL